MRAAPLGGLAPALVWLVLAGDSPAAETVPDLYQATVFVTGQGAETRAPGFARAFAAVLVKVSGDPGLGDDAAVAALARRAADFVDAFSYRDRMEGIPVHDEQGSRDRPYDLTVSFDAAAIDAALQAIGSAPWAGPRPELVVVVVVENGETRFTLTADGARGRDMREAMAAAAAQYGMPVELPTEAMVAAAAAGDDGLAALAAAAGADMAVAGRLLWSDAELGWTAGWQASVHGIPYRWTAHRVSFDNAFRAAIGGAAQILSGHGAPD